MFPSFLTKLTGKSRGEQSNKRRGLLRAGAIWTDRGKFQEEWIHEGKCNSKNNTNKKQKQAKSQPHNSWPVQGVGTVLPDAQCPLRDPGGTVSWIFLALFFQTELSSVPLPLSFIMDNNQILYRFGDISIIQEYFHFKQSSPHPLSFVKE